MNYQAELCRNARICEEKGLVNAIEGNMSLLDAEAGLLYLTPSRTRKLTLAEDEVAVVDFATGEQRAGKRASSEWRLHVAALRTRPDCRAVVHAHPVFLTAHAALNRPLTCDFLNLFTLVDGSIPCLPYGTAGTANIAAGIEEALAHKPLCLLGNHGAVAVGATLEEAIGWMEAFEAAARTAHFAQTMGAPVPIPTHRTQEHGGASLR